MKIIPSWSLSFYLLIECNFYHNFQKYCKVIYDVLWSHLRYFPPAAPLKMATHRLVQHLPETCCLPITTGWILFTSIIRYFVRLNFETLAFYWCIAKIGKPPLRDAFIQHTKPEILTNFVIEYFFSYWIDFFFASDSLIEKLFLF